MTKPRSPSECAAGSQVPGLASSSAYAADSDNAWGVNFNNGNSNINNRNNYGFVRAVRGPVLGSARSSEYPHAADVSLRALYEAWRLARAGKKPSRNQLEFDSPWMDRLLDLQAALSTGTWRPGPTTCFIATRPKAREIHAPDFADRVVHHWLVPQLEAIYEPTFIHDSYSNRKGKGTHAAVERLQAFVRQVHSGQAGGWYLQLDVRNFFITIHRPTLWTMLKLRMQRAGIQAAAQLAAHALLRQSPVRQGVVHRSTALDRAKVPAHKKLENAPMDCGLQIGNLSSQFLANVYLNELDQFVKHTLKAKRYVRYVDDFVLVHRDRAQLFAWKAAIERFLADRLRLQLKPEFKIKPLASGIDFLGYLVHPTHTLIRPRVIHHAREKLDQWQARHFAGETLRATPAQYRAIRSTWASYAGHFRHGNTFHLRQAFENRYPWLRAIKARRRFDHRLEGRPIEVVIARNAP